MLARGISVTYEFNYKSEATTWYQSSKYMDHHMIKSCSLNSTNNKENFRNLRKMFAKALFIYLKARNIFGEKQPVKSISSKIKLNHYMYLVLFNQIDKLYKLQSNISLKIAPPRGNVLAFQKKHFYSKFNNSKSCLDSLKVVQYLLRLRLRGFFLYLELRTDIAY